MFMKNQFLYNIKCNLHYVRTNDTVTMIAIRNLAEEQKTYTNGKY